MTTYFVPRGECQKLLRLSLMAFCFCYFVFLLSFLGHSFSGTCMASINYRLFFLCLLIVRNFTNCRKCISLEIGVGFYPNRYGYLPCFSLIWKQQLSFQHMKTELSLYLQIFKSISFEIYILLPALFRCCKI